MHVFLLGLRGNYIKKTVCSNVSVLLWLSPPLGKDSDADESLSLVSRKNAMYVMYFWIY